MRQDEMVDFEKIEEEKDPVAKARLINFLTKEKNIKLKEIAQALGTTSSYLCHLLRLLRLPEIVIDGYYTKTVSLTHLFVISRLKDQKEVVGAYEQCLRRNLTVYQLEEYIREKLYGIKTADQRVEERTKSDITQKFKRLDKDLNVTITQTRIQAKVIFKTKGNFKKTGEFLNKLAND